MIILKTEKNVMYYSLPILIQKERRNNITIKVSFDDGQTWPEEYWTLLDEGRGVGVLLHDLRLTSIP